MPGPYWSDQVPMLTGAIRIETVLVAMVVLNLIGLSIAAYFVMRRK